MRFLWKILCKNGRLFVILCIFMFFLWGNAIFSIFHLEFCGQVGYNSGADKILPIRGSLRCNRILDGRKNIFYF